MEKFAEKKIALVTGGAGVLGQAISEALVMRGVHVVVMDNNMAAFEQIEMSENPHITALNCDITDVESVRNSLAKIEKEIGDVDILVNNAGILSNNKVESTSIDEWNIVLNVNLTGAFNVTRCIIPGMKRKRWGRIINISSLAAKNGGLTAGTAYSVSKGAVNSLTFSLAAELAYYGITVNCIAPAYVKTPMITDQLTEKQRQTLLNKIPVRRFCDASEVAHTICFLVDDLAGFITGEVIDQNGGLYFD